MTHALQDTICACERKVWDALVAGDSAADDALLSAEFLGVYADGFAGKADHVGQVSDGPTVARYVISDWRFKTLASDTVLVAYHASFTRVSSQTDEAMYVTSIWQNRADQWFNIFSQDTPA